MGKILKILFFLYIRWIFRFEIMKNIKYYILGTKYRS